MSYDYVRRTYGVNPIVGERVRHHIGHQRLGTIVREKPSTAHYVMVLFDDKPWPLPCHPTEMDYLGKEEPI